MTSITLPRAVVQQVRDALAVSTTPLARDRQTVLKAIAALDEALAQPAPPSEERAIWCDHCGEGTIPGLCRGKVPFAGCPAKTAPTPAQTFTMTVADAMRIVDANVSRQEVEAAFQANVRHTPTPERPTNCGTSICSCIECVMEPELPPLPSMVPIEVEFDEEEDVYRAYGHDADQMQAYARAAVELHAKRGSEAPLPDDRAAFDDLLDAAEEWERFVDVDRALMNLRKWLERAALAQRSAETSGVRALREENARLRGDCVEWLCARCQTIHPSQRGRTFLQPCPECGEAMEPTSFNIRALKRMDAIIEAARAALEALELHAKQYPHMQKGYTVDAIDALSAALPQQN